MLKIIFQKYIEWGLNLDYAGIQAIYFYSKVELYNINNFKILFFNTTKVKPVLQLN